MSCYTGPPLSGAQKTAVIVYELKEFTFLTFDQITHLVPTLLSILPVDVIPFNERAAYISASISIPFSDALRVLSVFDALDSGQDTQFFSFQILHLKIICTPKDERILIF